MGRGLANTVVGLLLLATLAGCGAEPDTPEAQVRALLARAEEAAEARDPGALKEMVSERYADARDNDRDAIGGLLAFTLLRNQSVHLLSRIGAIGFPAPERAITAVFVAMAGRPIPGPEALAGLRASLYRFDFELAHEGAEWRVVRADWRPARPEDFR